MFGLRLLKPPFDRFAAFLHLLDFVVHLFRNLQMVNTISDDKNR